MQKRRASAPKAEPSAKRPRAAQELFDEQLIVQKWRQARPVGAGLLNLGNTCFMNSILQAITHVPAFAELCLRREALPHRGRSITPDVQNHVKKALLTGGPAGSVSASLRPPAPFPPKPLARSLRLINKGCAPPRPPHPEASPCTPPSHPRPCRFRLGRQEDAHEYLRCLLDFMHESHVACVQPRPPPDVQATSFVHAVFGGRTRSQIQCTGVKYESSVFEPFLDLSLQITGCGLDRAPL